MEIRFIRMEGLRDRVSVRRPSGGETSWEAPTHGHLLPHDLVHAVVEAAFGVADGFWGRVATGMDVTLIKAEASRRGGANTYADMGERRGLLIAEAFTTAPWFEPGVTPALLLERVLAKCARYGVEPPVNVTLARLEEVQGVLGRLEARWKQLGANGTLLLKLSLANLEDSFQEMAPPVFSLFSREA